MDIKQTATDHIGEWTLCSVQSWRQQVVHGIWRLVDVWIQQLHAQRDMHNIVPSVVTPGQELYLGAVAQRTGGPGGEVVCRYC